MDATRVRRWGGRSSTAVSSTARFETAALGSPASDESTVGGDPSPPCSTALPVLILASLGSLFVVVVTADPASGARATESVTKEVPRFANWSQDEAWRVEQPP